jgi:hypothetical protein
MLKVEGFYFTVKLSTSNLNKNTMKKRFLKSGGC